MPEPRSGPEEWQTSVKLVDGRGELEFRRLLEKLPAGAYTCDCQGLITFYNQHAVSLWGRTPQLHDRRDRFCGSFRLFSADGGPLDHEQCWMALALQDNQEYNGNEIIIERPDGSRLTVLAYANPIRDEQGTLLGAVNVLVDVTDRKRAEMALREADRRKNEFLAMLGHELRNPLVPIRSGISLLQREHGETETLRLMQEQIDHLVHLVDDLLDVSRIVRGHVELHKQPVELSVILTRAVQTVQGLIDERQHELSMTMLESAIWVDADPVRLTQVITNLLNNAVKYTAPGGRIAVAVQVDKGDARVSVRDSGCGIEQDLLPHIFEPFTQSNRTMDRSLGGLGVGLTLVRSLVEMHGGTITAHSAGIGQGSEFVMRLPLTAAETRSALLPRPASGAPCEGLRVLVVDDHHVAAKMLSRLLENFSAAQVYLAHDGPSAIAAAERYLPDVILLDLGLPGLDGYAVARHLRQDPRFKSTRLVAVTGYGQADDISRSQEAGFDQHLVKPPSLDAILKVLQD